LLPCPAPLRIFILCKNIVPIFRPAVIITQMAEPDDMQLLKEYAARNSEAAFAALVQRHINLVYSVALRHVRDAHKAQDVTQAVFIILAQKAARLRNETVLTGWLYQTARHVSASLLRGEMRRQRREQESFMESTLEQSQTEAAWESLSPILDAAMGRLGKPDRDVILLRFFEGKSVSETALALHINEPAAKKRVTRALEKLRKFFTKRGITLSATALATVVASNSVQAAPAVLAKSITAVAVTKGAAASISTLTLITGALKIMAWTKAKTAIVVTVGVLLAAGTATVTVKEVKAHKAYLVALDSWRVSLFKPDTLSAALPQTRILPTKFKPPVYGVTTDGFGHWAAHRAPVRDIVRTAYNWPSGRIVFANGEPKERYDFVATLQDGPEEALQQELKKTLGLVGRTETRETDVLLLRVRTPDAPGLKPHISGGVNEFRDIRGRIQCLGEPLSSSPPLPPFGLTKFLELFIGVPVIDETGFGFMQRFDIDIRWNENEARDPEHNALKQAVLDQLGLELVPGTESVEMLVVEKAK